MCLFKTGLCIEPKQDKTVRLNALESFQGKLYLVGCVTSSGELIVCALNLGESDIILSDGQPIAQGVIQKKASEGWSDTRIIRRLSDGKYIRC